MQRIAEEAGLKFIRQQWRMWIETDYSVTAATIHPNSFASNGECGLKQAVIASCLAVVGIHSPAMANVD